MNIFLLDKNLSKAAVYHNDKHVVKMRTEYNQLLSGAHLTSGGKAPYKLTHKNHPASLWVRESIENYILLWNLNLELCKEFEYRFNTSQKSLEILNLLKNPPKLPEIKGTLPYSVWKQEAFPNLIKTDDVILTNRAFYKEAKKHLISYKKRRIPEWLY